MMADGKTPTALVVDDNPATRYSTGRVLKSGGFAILQAATGREALALAVERPDVVVLDVNLPDIDGFQVCRELRTIAETARIPVIHLSATFVSDNDKIHGFESGADGYLTHPVEPLVLIATVNAFLRTRRAEEELRISESKFRAIFDRVQNGICLFNHRLEFVEANPAMCQMLRRSREELFGHPLRELTTADVKQQLKSVQHSLEQLGSWQGTFALLDSENCAVEFDWQLSVHSDPGIWLAIVTDATERITAEIEREQLLASERVARSAAERANRLKDEFLATLSHELRTPLSAILGWSHILRTEKKIDQADFESGLDAIQRNARIQKQLIEDLLDVSRITSGKLRLDIEAVNVATVTSSALESLLPVASSKGVEIISDLDPDAGTVFADPSRLQQVIWNLVSNAVKFSSSGGKVFVRMRKLESSIELSVVDEGQGISPEFVPHIFERFRQQDASVTRNYGGLGLGLAIVRHLIELHGGTVQAESPGLNKGATFVIRLPIATGQKVKPEYRGLHKEMLSRSVTDSASSEKLTNIRVLVVDDDDDTRALVSRLLRDRGADVVTCSDAAQALDQLSSWNPMVILSDIGMPNQSGYDLIRQVRLRGYDSRRLPAIALTAFARAEDRRRAISEGFQLHLEKPVDPSELTAAIGMLVRDSTDRME